MIKKKSSIALVLAVLMISLSPIASLAEVQLIKAPDEEMNIVPISEPIKLEDEKTFQYITFKGIIEEVDDSENFRILVRREVTEGLDVLWAYINEDVLLLNDKTKDTMDKTKLEVGMEVSVIYHKDTVMALSYPPLLGPDVVLVHEEGANGFFYVERFDEELVSYDNFLKLILEDETIILDRKGNNYLGDLENKDLVVFYGVSTKSIPAQTRPEKIYVLEDEQLDYREVKISEDMIIERNNIKLIPLRYVAEELGFKVTWHEEKRGVELLNGIHWTYLTIGENNYSYARMLIKLEMEPIIVNSRTFVPLSFAEEVLKADLEMDEDGSILIFK